MINIANMHVEVASLVHANIKVVSWFIQDMVNHGLCGTGVFGALLHLAS